MREGWEEDATLVGRMARRDEAALACLYDRYASRIFTLALHICRDAAAAEEVVQDAFLAIWREAARYDPRRGGVLTWLFGVARNRSIDYLRHQARRPVLLLDESDGSRVAPAADTAAQAETDVLAAEAKRLLSDLPAIYREPLQLAYFQGLSQREIAERLGIPLGTVKTRTRTAIERLRQAMHFSEGLAKEEPT